MDECTRQIAFSPGNTTRRITKRLAAPRRVASHRHESRGVDEPQVRKQQQSAKHLHS